MMFPSDEVDVLLLRELAFFGILFGLVLTKFILVFKLLLGKRAY